MDILNIQQSLTLDIPSISRVYSVHALDILSRAESHSRNTQYQQNVFSIEQSLTLDILSISRVYSLYSRVLL
jgi:hypothetical protein